MSLTTPAIELYIDLTTSAHAAGRSAGSTRVEWQFAHHVAARAPWNVEAVSWSASENDFVRLPGDVLRAPLDASRIGSQIGHGVPVVDEARAHSGTRRVLLVTGAGWLSNAHVLHATRRLRARLGAELHTVIHDVVHLQCPHWFDRQTAGRLGANMAAMMASADVLLVYSRSTAADVEDVASRLRIPHGPLQAITLGADLPTTVPGDIPLADLGIPSNRPFVLYVSTVTFRKNHAFLCNVWRRLARDLGQTLPTLVCVGHVADDQLALVDRVRRDPLASQHVRFISGVDDATLSALYERCAFTVFPSLYEGWGLPVAESLAHGKVCVASDSSSLPEVTGGCGVHLDPYDHAAWCSTLRDFVTEPLHLEILQRGIRDRYRPTSWAQASARLIDTIASAAPHAPVSASSSPPAGGAIGWRMAAIEGLPQPPASRAIARLASRGRLGLLLDRVPPHGLRLWLTARALGTSPQHVHVDVSGTPVDAWPLDPSEPGAPHALDVPSSVVQQCGLLDLDVRSVHAHMPTDAGTTATLVIETLRLEALPPEDSAGLDQRQRMLWAPDAPLTFGFEGRGHTVLAEGWGAPAPWGVWSVAPEAVLRFVPVTRGVRTIYLQAVVRAFVWPTAPSLDVAVLVDDEPVGTWVFHAPDDRTRAERHIAIAWRPTSSEIVTVTFGIPGCRSPKDVGLSSDDRRLGLGLLRAQWSLAPPAAPGASQG